MKTLLLKALVGASAIAGLAALQACNSEQAEEMGADLTSERTAEVRSEVDACGGIILRSCKEILDALPEATTRNYSIDPDGPNGPQPPFEVYCDMTSDGGGFTLLARSDKQRSFDIKPWVDLLSQNYFGDTTLTTTTSVLPGYLSSHPFFALLSAEADIVFQDVRITDGLNASVQSLASRRTLRQIHETSGAAPLYQGATNTGVLLLLGNSAHTSTPPCYYPTLNGLGCSAFYTGDTGSQTTAFYAGNLHTCASGPAAGSLPRALWGSSDCYGTDTSGGFGGFTYSRPNHLSSGLGAYANGGYLDRAWAIYIR